MTPDEQLARDKLAIETRLKRTDQEIARKQFALTRDRFEWEKSQAAHSGWRLLLTPTGVVLAGAALGLLGTAAGKWADYQTTKRQQETTIILKASDVPATLSAKAQVEQRARNLLWFSQARYIELPPTFVIELTRAANLPAGETVPAPIIQSTLPGSLPRAAGLDLVAKFEGFSANPMSTSGGQKIIGFGHILTQPELTSKTVSAGTELYSFEHGLTVDQARELLAEDMKASYETIDRLVKTPLSAPQRDALASFVFNVGGGNFKSSSLLKLLNEGRLEEVPAQLNKWTVRNGVQPEALMKRRQMEIELWKRAPASAASR